MYSISHTIQKHAINALYFTHMHSYMTIRNLCYKGRGFSVLILDQKYTYTHIHVVHDHNSTQYDVYKGAAAIFHARSGFLKRI